MTPADLINWTCAGALAMACASVAGGAFALIAKFILDELEADQ